MLQATRMQETTLCRRCISFLGAHASTILMDRAFCEMSANSIMQVVESDDIDADEVSCEHYHCFDQLICDRSMYSKHVYGGVRVSA